jgi:hypothetical protein
MPSQVDRNFEAFKKLLPKLLRTHAGKFALMHDGDVVDLFETLGEAASLGFSKFGEGQFSVQEVTSKNINLGSYSYALHRHPD